MNQIGLIARADNTGLGIQTHELYKHINPQKTLVVNVNRLNHLQNHFYRYPGCKIVTDQMSLADINEFLSGLKVIFCCETPYNYELFREARNRGIKIVLQYNYEFLELGSLKNSYWPDVFASPSSWQIQEVKDKFKNVMHLPVPVNRQLLTYSEKKKFKRFLHIVGNAAAHDRNGTHASIEAFDKANLPDCELVVRCFNTSAVNSLPKGNGKNITINTHNTTNYEHNYIGFDALILPRKYGGLCLPMQEALSCGMPVIMTDISPNSDVLPKEWLIPTGNKFTFHSKHTIEVNEPDVNSLTEKIKWFASMDEKTCIENSEIANKIADALDWNIWKKKYIDLFNS